MLEWNTHYERRDDTQINSIFDTKELEYIYYKLCTSFMNCTK